MIRQATRADLISLAEMAVIMWNSKPYYMFYKADLRER